MIYSTMYVMNIYKSIRISLKRIYTKLIYTYDRRNLKFGNFVEQHGRKYTTYLL